MPTIVDMIAAARAQGVTGFGVDYSKFLAACESDDVVEVIGSVVQGGARVDFTGVDSATSPTTQAAASGMVRDDVVEQSFTPLMVAANAGSAHVVEALLHLDADPNAQAVDGSTALILASYKNHPRVTRVLVRVAGKKLDCTRALKADNSNALFVAAQSGHTGVLRELLAGHTEGFLSKATGLGKVLNAPVSYGAFPLYVAAACNHSEAVHLLAATRGVKIDKYENVTSTARPRTAVSVVSEGKEEDEEEQVITVASSQSALFAAVQLHHLDSIRELMLAKADIHTMPADAHMSPLMLAVYSGAHDVAALLLEHGECDDARVQSGMDTAAFLGDFRMVALLVGAGMDPNQVNESNESAAMILKACHGLTLEEALAIDPVPKEGKKESDEAKFPEGMEGVTTEQSKRALDSRLRGGGTPDYGWLEHLLRRMNFETVLGHRFATYVDLVYNRMDVEHHGKQLKPKHMLKEFYSVYRLHQIHLFKGLVPS